MTKALKIIAGEFTFDARLETELAPKTCAAFLERLPYHSQIVHVRWSGEGVWVPLGDADFGVSYENHTSHPAPGQVILYPGVLVKLRSCSPTAASPFPRKWDSLLETTSSH